MNFILCDENVNTIKATIEGWILVYGMDKSDLSKVTLLHATEMKERNNFVHLLPSLKEL